MTEDSKEKSSDKEAREETARLQSLVKGALLAGVNAVLLTEDSVRGFLKDKKLPTEWALDLMSNAGRKKDDLFGLLGKEATKFFQHLDFQKELSSFLSRHTMTIKAEVSFRPKEEKKKNG